MGTINKTIINTELPVVSVPEILGTVENIIKLYNNASTDKSNILSENKGKAGIYLWKHKESNKSYIGSAVDLYKRLSYYYSASKLKRVDNYISRAIICHTHSAFSLSIIEYIDIKDLSKDEARKLILKREQHYIDSLKPEFNINPIAGSRLGSLHTEESKTLMSRPKSEKTKALISLAMSGQNHPMFGKNHSAETILKMSEAMSGENNPMHGRTHSSETLAKISKARGTIIYVYSPDKSTLIDTFPSAYKAGKYFKVSHPTILKYCRNGEIFKDKWFLSTSLIINE